MEVVLLEMMADPDAVIIMHDGGVIGGHIMNPFFSHEWAAQEMFWYAELGGGALLEAFEAWAYSEGAELVSMAGLGGPKEKTIRKLYERKGYEARETFFVKTLVNQW